MNNYFYFKKFNKIMLVILFATVLLIINGCGQKNKQPIDEKEINKNQISNNQASGINNKNNTNKKPQNDAGTGGDVTDDLESPQPVDAGEYKGTLFPAANEFGAGGDIDAYGIKWAPGDTLEITIIPSKNLDVAFRGFTNGHPSEIALRNDGFKGELETLSMTSDATSDVTLAMIQIMPIKSAGDYTLKINKVHQNDGDKNQDAPEDWDQPLNITFGNYSDCFLGSKDEFDDYGIKLTSGQKILIQVEPSETLDVLLGQDEFHLTNQINKGFKGEREKIDITATEDGIYKFSVGKVGKTTGRYTLRISEVDD